MRLRSSVRPHLRLTRSDKEMGERKEEGTHQWEEDGGRGGGEGVHWAKKSGGYLAERGGEAIALLSLLGVPPFLPRG